MKIHPLFLNRGLLALSLLSLGACGVKVKGGASTGDFPVIPGGTNPTPSETDAIPASAKATGAVDAKYVRCSNSFTEVYADLSQSDFAQEKLSAVKFGNRSLEKQESTFTLQDIEYQNMSHVDATEENPAGWEISLLSPGGMQGVQFQVLTADFLTGKGKLNQPNQYDEMSCTFLKEHIYSGKAGW
jgi:hypothetical protein